MFEALTGNSYFYYSADMEYLFAALDILIGLNKNQRINEIYGENMKKEVPEKYPLLFEVFHAFSKDKQFGIIEPIIDFDLSKFSLDNYCEELLQMDRVTFLTYYTEALREDIEKALISEEELLKFYHKYPKISVNFLGLQMLFKSPERYIKAFFEFAKSLKNDAAERLFKKHEKDINKEMKRLKKNLETIEPLAQSEKIMGKTFYNRGPYEKFIFMPCEFGTMRACRLFGKNQFLFYDFLREEPYDSEKVLVEQLKVISDSTRLNILKLLKTNKHLCGAEIATQMSLAPSTVSHHMDQLKNFGLVHEEPVKSAKYYSLNEPNIKNCLKTLEKVLLTEEKK